MDFGVLGGGFAEKAFQVKPSVAVVCGLIGYGDCSGRVDYFDIFFKALEKKGFSIADKRSETYDREATLAARSAINAAHKPIFIANSEASSRCDLVRSVNHPARFYTLG